MVSAFSGYNSLDSGFGGGHPPSVCRISPCPETHYRFYTPQNINLLSSTGVEESLTNCDGVVYICRRRIDLSLLNNVPSSTGKMLSFSVEGAGNTLQEERVLFLLLVYQFVRLLQCSLLSGVTHLQCTAASSPCSFPGTSFKQFCSRVFLVRHLPINSFPRHFRGQISGKFQRANFK